MKLLYDFTVDKEKKTILVTREFAASRTLVWDAFTNPEIIDQWWAPKPWKAQTKIMDFREGGYWLYAMIGPNGEEHWSKAEFIKITPFIQYTGLDYFSNAEGNKNANLPQSNWEVTFKDHHSNTIVEYYITYDDLAQLEATLEMGFKEGLTIAMEGLDVILKSL